MYDRTKSAGLRLLEAQKQQGTNLCIGVDVHLNPKIGLGPEFYAQFTDSDLQRRFTEVCTALQGSKLAESILLNGPELSPPVLAGVVNYFLTVTRIAWNAGIRVFKPQSAFYEQFGIYSPIILGIICETINQRGEESDEPYFLILDAKRGDISSTQAPYYKAYLSGVDDEVIPGLRGGFDVDAITVMTWMGIDVLEPGLEWFKQGKGAIIVTRSSNPSGTALQDGFLVPDPELLLSKKQEPFRLTKNIIAAVQELIDRNPTAAEVMLYLTQKFSDDNSLTTNGVSPLMSVMGSTVVEGGSFRKIRPSGIALVPGFGAQSGKFGNAMPLLDPDTGQGAIFSSSRGHNFSWMEKYGGSDDPKNIEDDLKKAIDAFRQSEKEAYEVAGIHYPYN